MNKFFRSYGNVLVIAGTGRNSGKTMLACRIISKFNNLKPVAVKISPHFHEPGRGLIKYHTGEDFNIYTESSRGGIKDTNRMLKAGAAEAYYIQAYDKDTVAALGMVLNKLEETRPVICESPALAKYIDPGVLFLTDNNELKQKKEIKDLLTRADRVFYPMEEEISLYNLDFSAGSWVFIR